MVVLEAPTWHDWPVAGLGPERYGHVVMFRLDLPACIAALQDEEASRAAALLPQDWFVGIIMATGALDAHNEKDEALLNFRFSLLGQGLPDPPSASVPIGGSPPINEERPAIPLDPSLPWPGLYVHTFQNAVAVISRIHHGTGHVPPRLNKDEISRLRKIEVSDGYHRVRDVDPHAQGDAASGTGSSDDGADDLPSDDAQPIFEKLGSLHFYVDLWLDPAAFTGTPASPRAYAETIQALRRIGDEWADRQLCAVRAKRPTLTNEWRHAVDKAQSDQRPASGHYSRRSYSEQPLSDDAILPEDAVDYRVEQAMLANAYILRPARAPEVGASDIPHIKAVTPIGPDDHVAASIEKELLSPDHQHEPAVADSIAQPTGGNTSPVAHPSTSDEGQPPLSTRTNSGVNGRALKILQRLRSDCARLKIRVVQLLGQGGKS